MREWNRRFRVVAGSSVAAVVLAAGLVAGMVVGAMPARAQMAQSYRPARIYPEVEAARQEIRAALLKARREHKRVILDFGGDWCGDCQVLNIYFQQSPNAELLKKYFVLVDVNVGYMDKNVDIAKKYGVPLKGVPALAVLDATGKVIYAQNKEFADMRHMSSAAVTDFLNKWKR